MTQPTRTVGRVAAALVTVLGMLAVATACRIPLPTIFRDDKSDQVETSTSVGETAAAERALLLSEPQFTPFTVAPSILNRSEVVEAMVREYPPLLREAGIGGTVRLYFFIDEDGRVQDVRVDKSSGHPAIDQAASAVAEVYEFTPAMNQDVNTPAWVSFPITFQAR